MFANISNYFESLNAAGQALFIVGVLLIITFIALLIVVFKPDKHKVKKIYGESAITDKENIFEEKMKDIDNIGLDDINLENDKTRNLKNIVDELKNVSAKEMESYEERIQRYEDDQEDTAIISIDELLKSTAPVTYETIKSSEPVIREDTVYKNILTDTQEIKVAVPPVNSYIERKQDVVTPQREERKYVPTREIFSSVFANNDRPEVKKENTDDNEKFLNSLKEFRNNL